METVQRGAGKLTRGVEGLPYDEQARSPSLFVLEEGGLRASLAKDYEITKGVERLVADLQSTLSQAQATCAQMKLVGTKFIQSGDGFSGSQW